MENDKQKMKEFIGKLWSNPNLQKTPMDKKENQILSFLKENQASIQKVFSQDDYFPHLNWNETMRLLLSELVEKILLSISPNLEKINQNSLLPAVFESFGSKTTINSETFTKFFIDLFRTKVMRDQILSSIQIISLGYFDNYVPDSMDKRKYIFNEIYRRDRLKMEIPIIPKYLSLVTLFRPLFYLPLKYRPGSDETMSLAQGIKEKKLYDSLLVKLDEYLNENLGNIPQEIYLSGIQGNLNLYNFREISGAAKLIAVFAARSADYAPLEKQDRGADAPDKSWFQINRRNAKSYGIDADIIEELYQIAGDRGW